MKIITLLAVLCLQAKDKMVLVAPDDSTEQAIVQAAKALEKRCADYGYAGITYKVEGKKIHLTCVTGFQTPMVQVLGRFASIPGQKVELRTQYELSDVERQQFSPPNAPVNAEWVPAAVHPTMKILLKKQIHGGKGDLQKRDDPENPRQFFYELNKDVDAKTSREAMYLFIDSHAYHCGRSTDHDKPTNNKSFGRKYTKLSFNDSYPVFLEIDSIIRNPLPFHLKMEN